MIHSAIQNNPISINLMDLYRSRGYTILTNGFSHIKGYDNRPLIIGSYNIQPNSEYNISFQVSSTDSTTNVYFTVGGYTSTNITTNSFVNTTFDTTTSAPLTFIGTGNFTITNVNISRQLGEIRSTSEDTITFSEERKKWVTFKSIVPDCGFSMYTNLFTYKDGYLYKHTETAVPNKFYGEQFHSEIKFPVTSVGVKTYQAISIHANKVMATTEDGIVTQLGQVSDLVTEDFETREGVHSAVFFRDKLTGLLDGEKLKGRYVVIELTDEDSSDKKLQIFKVVVKSNISSPNE